MQIGMLGPLEVRGDDGAPADVPGARLRGLLVALARQPGRVVPKAALIDWIWGENPPSDATNALHRLVSRLRKLLPDGAIEGHTDGYRLAVEPDAVDAVRFERLAAQARGLDGPRRVQLLREALGLWRGAALQDVGLTESPAFDAAVARLDGLRLAATEDRFEAETALGHGAELVTELTDLVAAHPLRERLVAALMRALVAAGRDADALLVYERTREELADTLGADPSPELSALHVALLKGEVGRRDDDRRTNLRAELTSYIGKDADVAAVRELVGTRRLTTLVGPGGSGKTRLATETARALLDDLPDGVWLVELASVTADGDVAQATVAALGLRDPLLGDQPDAEPADRLVAALRDREVLLVLDNCEHVIESAAALAHRLLGECPRLRILATSRESLGITGEALWPVVPLTLPDDDAEPAAIEASPAVRLLLDRASAVRTDLTVDAASLATMARICRALDGMPLAIELAAARLRTMTLDQLAGRLDHRFRLLTSGSRTVLPRHQTLRAVVDWSWELLGEPERTVLRRLSVFTGGAGLDAAERVCAGDDVHPEDVLELLGSLTEKSLLVAEGGGAPRYRLLGTIKEYAAQRLAEAGETESARRAHLACFTELVETAEPWLRRAEQVEWLATLDAEHGNIVAAMRGALAAGDAAAAMRLAASAGWYWWFSGHKAEGEELVAAAAAMPGEVDDETRALVYTFVAGFLTSGREDAQRAETWIREAHRLSPDGRSTRTVLRLLAPLERLLQGPDGAVSAWEPVLDDEDPWVRALARLQRGKMRIMLGDGGRDADADLEEALAQFRAIGERYGTSFALTELADRRAARGEFAAACDLLEEAATVVAELGAVEDVIRIRSRQAQLYWLAGDEDASAAAVAEAQRHADRVTWPNALAELALARADLARWRGDADEARRQLAAAIGLLHDTGDQPHLRAMEHDLLGYLAAGDEEARAHRAAAVEAAAVSGYPALIAVVLVGVADLALRRGDDEQAVRLLAAGAAVRGMADRSHPDVARIERAARSRLGDTRYAEAAREGATAGWSELVEVTLAS
ncbi:BTAD domain-containing putative transcriptional regulator [Jiangella anatolica]|uniref:AfsR family transcriptional regulator n=1 Tax=Jiangella anatolica TaxID=2670374 RepID=A0A2W2CEL6_9ACTN|nr:BTAD domain-containing putative transcriptional regulator [Jiangella anatolica]PZF86747.1 AfsR family transcriptional regulator [Jiangella anatolica]